MRSGFHILAYLVYGKEHWLHFQGYAKIEEYYNKNSHVVDDLKEMTKVLRSLPLIDPVVPTVCLVGAPNVGKSSIVRQLSTGKPEICNYPFTTRGIIMGHIYVDFAKFQVNLIFAALRGFWYLILA